MAAGIYLTCQGLPFMQGGEEFARTKHGDHNTYRGPLELNRLDWTRAAQLEELVQYYHGLLEIRKAYPELSGMAGDAEPCILSLPGWLIGFVPERRGESLPGGWPFIITRSAPASGRPCLPGAGAICAMVPVPPPNLLAPPAAMPSNSPPSA